MFVGIDQLLEHYPNLYSHIRVRFFIATSDVLRLLISARKCNGSVGELYSTLESILNWENYTITA